MEDKIKQRILGALVLVGFVCVILSFLFHRSGPSVEEKIAAQMNMSTQTVASNTSTTTSAPTSLPVTTIAAQSTQATAPVVVTSNMPLSTTTTTEPTEQPGVTSSTGTTANNNATSVTNKLVAQASSNEANVDQIQAAAENAALQEMNQKNNKTTLATTSTASPSTPAAPAPSSVASQQTSSATSNVNQSVTTKEPAQPSHVIKTAQSPQAHAIAHHHASLSGAWAIQVGVFSNTANAKTLVSKLRAKHFEAYVHHAHHNGKTLAIVFVGPEISKQKSLRVQAELKHAFHLHGIVKKYQM